MSPLDVLIVGAGLSGVMIGHKLSSHPGYTFEIWDKGRSVGGRMATRRFGDNGANRADHGAQFFTARHIRIQEYVNQWVSNEWIYEWPNFSPNPIGEKRWIARGGMNTLVKRFGETIQSHIRTEVTVNRVSLLENGFFEVQARLADGSTCQQLTNHILFTCPTPQALAICDQSELRMSISDREALEKIVFAPCLALMIECTQPQTWANEQLKQLTWPNGIRFLADNQQKGISNQSILTIHADPEWSTNHYDLEDEIIKQKMVQLLDPHLSANEIQAVHLKKWRYAQAVQTSTLPFLCSKIPHAKGDIIFSGDAFAAAHPLQAGRVENALLSGYFCAEYLT